MKQKRRVNHSPHRVSVNLIILNDRNATVAHASVTQWIDGEMVTDEATGSSKREPGDTRDDVIATEMAMARALINLGRSMLGTSRILVSVASAQQELESRRRVVNRLRRIRGPRQDLRMPIEEIIAQRGYDAADRAADRRGEPRPKRPGHGRHEMPDVLAEPGHD